MFKFTLWHQHIDIQLLRVYEKGKRQLRFSSDFYGMSRIMLSPLLRLSENKSINLNNTSVSKNTTNETICALQNILSIITWYNNKKRTLWIRKYVYYVVECFGVKSYPDETAQYMQLTFVRSFSVLPKAKLFKCICLSVWFFFRWLKEVNSWIFKQL